MCMKAYESKLPSGFHDKISSPVITMAAARKSTKLGGSKTFDTEVIFNQTLGIIIIISSGNFVLQTLFRHELAPIPTSLFQEDGNMQLVSSKSKLKTFLAVEQ